MDIESVTQQSLVRHLENEEKIHGAVQVYAIKRTAAVLISRRRIERGSRCTVAHAVQWKSLATALRDESVFPFKKDPKILSAIIVCVLKCVYRKPIRQTMYYVVISGNNSRPCVW